MNTRYPPFNTLQGKTQLHNNGQRGKNARLIGLGGGGGIGRQAHQAEGHRALIHLRLCSASQPAPFQVCLFTLPV